MTHTINSARTAAVATDVFWQPITPDTPHSVKLQLINKNAGIATYGQLTGKGEYWTHWAPLPKWGVL